MSTYRSGRVILTTRGGVVLVLGYIAMAELSPEFTHDIFVSYSHGDFDHTGTSLLKEWSLAFVRELEAELRLTPGLRNTAVFIDASDRSDGGLNAADQLTQQVRHAVSQSAFLLILMSPF